MKRKENPGKGKLSPAVAYVIIGVVFAGLVVALVVQVVAEGQMTSDIAVRTLIPMGACVLAFARVYSGNRRSHGTAFYEKQYEKEIAGAFETPDKKPERRRLLEGIRAYNEDRFERALRCLGMLPERCVTPADYAVTYLFLGLTYSDMGLLDKAAEAYKTALSHDVSRATIWNNLGMIYLHKGDTEKAAEYYRRASETDKTYATAYNNMAQLQLRLGRWKEAIPYAAHAIDLQSDLTPALNALAIAHYAMGERTKGRHYADRAFAQGTERQGMENIFAALDRGENPFRPFTALTPEVEEAVEHFRRRHSRPMLRVCMPAEGSTAGRSRVGGKTVGDAPLDSHGQPMRLLAAIWCSEVQGMADLPDRGILRFFIADDRDYGCYRHVPNEQTDFRVLYTPDEDAFGDCNFHMYFDPETTFPVRGCFPIWFMPGMSTPLMSDYRFRPLLEESLAKTGAPSVDALDPAVYRAICEQNQWGGHRMGGYPCFEQFDPRCQAVYQPYDALLLQIVTHEVSLEDGTRVAIVRFGNDGGCQFFIPRERLRACDFSNVLYWWDDVPEKGNV